MKKDMLVLCIHSQNPKRPEAPSKEEFIANREKTMKAAIEKKLPLKSLYSVSNDDMSKMWCVWETDTIERIRSVMDALPYIHTEIIPVWRLPQVM